MFEDVIKTWLLTFDFLFDDSTDHNFLWSVCDMWSIKYLMLNIIIRFKMDINLIRSIRSGFQDGRHPWIIINVAARSYVLPCDCFLEWLVFIIQQIIYIWNLQVILINVCFIIKSRVSHLCLQSISLIYFLLLHLYLWSKKLTTFTSAVWLGSKNWLRCR